MSRRGRRGDYREAGARLRQPIRAIFPTLVRRQVKAGRKRGAIWVRVFDIVRLAVTAEGRARLLTSLRYRHEVHQTTPYTVADRYPALFDFASHVAPNARRILSFGCSTGEELAALRLRFPVATIVGAEINPRSRHIAARRMASDVHVMVVPPGRIAGGFDLIFALAVLQREPHTVEELDIVDLSTRYRFDRFDSAVKMLVDRLEPGGLLFVTNNQYRIEDSSVFGSLDTLPQSPEAPGPFFGPDGMRLDGATARTAFRKRPRD